MIIEMEGDGYGWFRVDDFAVFWSRYPNHQGVARRPGDPWFAWKKASSEGGKGEGGCWLGQLQILWEYPTRAYRAAELARRTAQEAELEGTAAKWEAEITAEDARLEAEEAAEQEATIAWAKEFGEPLAMRH